jgi:hypothetical protein
MGTCYCENPECERPTKEGRKYCDRCYKRVQRGQPLTAPAPKLSPLERAFEAARTWVESPSDDDEAYERNKRAFISAAKDLGGRVRKDQIRQGMAAARARGVRLGRPPKLMGSEAMAQTLVAHLGIVAAAKAMRVDSKTLRRALRAKATISPPRPEGRVREKATISPSA